MFTNAFFILPIASTIGSMEGVWRFTIDRIMLMLSLMAGHSSDFLPQPCAAVMENDFEVIIEELKMELPSLHVEQVNKKNPADNDGLWFL